MPANTLNVKSEYAKGALSMYGWVDSVRMTKFHAVFMPTHANLYSVVISW